MVPTRLESFDVIPGFTAHKGSLAARDPKASGPAVLTHWASVVLMVGTAVCMDISVTPPPCHAPNSTLGSPQEHRSLPQQTEDMLKCAVTAFFFIILVHIVSKFYQCFIDKVSETVQI